MRKRQLATALFIRAFLSASSQQLSQVDQAIVDAARTRYYSLQEKGFVSLACTVPSTPQPCRYSQCSARQRRTF